MAVFVDLDDEDSEPPQNGPPLWNGLVDPVKLVPALATATATAAAGDVSSSAPRKHQREEAHEPAARENPNRNSMTQALGCYPIIMSLAASLDLNSLDSLSRTCRQIREGLLQYRTMLLVSTLHCVNEDIPVDPEETLRYRARAGNWYYMQDVGRTAYNGKSGQCARDMVGGCRRCGTVVCRNCAIKPPASIVLRDRHRRLCEACVHAPLGSLVKPPLGPEIRIDSDDMERAICTCGSEGVWLCQPCGRSIRGDDTEYKGIWKWRNQYTEVLGGLGTGIGEGDRGVICGRETTCCGAREREQETDGDAEDAREAEEHAHYPHSATTPLSAGSTSSNSTTSTTASSHAPPPLLWALGTTTTSNGTGGGGGPGSSTATSVSGGSSSLFDRRTPSPALKPGYERHEIEGIGGVMKKKRVRMVKVGACVPEWEDERAKGEILGREVQGRRRSWCGWCRRVVPSRRDYEMDRHPEGEGECRKQKGKERECLD